MGILGRGLKDEYTVTRQRLQEASPNEEESTVKRLRHVGISEPGTFLNGKIKKGKQFSVVRIWEK